MLAEVDVLLGSPVAHRQALLRAGLSGPRDQLASQLAIWAAQTRDWAALEEVWVSFAPAAILTDHEAAHAYLEVPKERRRQFPGLSLAFGIVQAVDPGTGDFDIDLLFKDLVREGEELHARWATQASVDAGVVAGTLWMLSQGSVGGSLADPSLGGAWDTQRAVQQFITRRSLRGEVPSTRTMAVFHALSCGIAVLRSDWIQAAFHAELGASLSSPGDIFGLVAQAAWATIGLVTGESVEVQRALDTAPDEALASKSMQDLLGMARLVGANLQLDRAAAEQVLGGPDLLSSWLRWFNYGPMFIANRAQAAILWADPDGALAEFDSSLPGSSIAEVGSYWGPVLLRTRTELLLNLRAVSRAAVIVDYLLGSENRSHGLVPGARLQLLVGNPIAAILLADEGMCSRGVPLADRAQLQAIKAAATLDSGADEADLQRQMNSACQLCGDAGSALGVALLPFASRTALLELHPSHADGTDCFLAQVVAQGRFDELRRNLAGESRQVRLTAHEKVLLPLLIQPFTVQEVAEQVFVSVNTVRKQLVTLRQKLGARNRAELVTRAQELGLSQLPD
jgi:DNA-binding NarL/FixJ family response regulator